MSENIRPGIGKLNSSNYSTWSYKAKLLLMKDKVWDVIRDPLPEVEKRDADWTSKDEAAQVIIGLLVEDSQLRHINNATTAHEQWNKLKVYYEKTTLSSQMALNRRLFKTVLEEGGNMDHHITKITEIIDSLAKHGQDIPDTTIVGILLGSIPESYDSLVMALESRAAKDITSDFIKEKLSNEYNRRQNMREVRDNSIDDSAMKVEHKEVGTKGKISCFFCKKTGHFKKDCHKYKTWKNKQGKANRVTECGKSHSDVCFLTKVTDLKTKGEQIIGKTCVSIKEKQADYTWYIDSGATSHMTASKEFFTEFDPSMKGSVQLAERGKNCAVQGIGSGILKCVVENEIQALKVKNVLYVPTLGSSLLSVKKLVNQGYRLHFPEFSDYCSIIKDGTVQASAHLEDGNQGLYKLKTPTEKAYAITKAAHGKDCQHVWHRRFGHRNPSAIKQLEEKGLASGILIKDCGIREICECCVKGKMVRTPFPKQSQTKTNAFLDLVHTDLCGPMQTVTPSGKRYTLTIIDDYSRYCTVYFLQYKSEAAKFIKDFVEMTKTQFNKRVKVIRSDRGREYINDDLQQYLKAKGIKMQYTAAYSPQQNGVAERKNRSLMEMARCMLIDANMDKKYWAEAINTANYLQNRLPTKAVEKTPYELCYSRKPDVKNLHIFGSKAYIHIHKEQRRKLDDKAEKLTFVGYCEESKAYRFLDKETSRIKISRDVVFIEYQHEERTKDDYVFYDTNPSSIGNTDIINENQGAENELSEGESNVSSTSSSDDSDSTFSENVPQQAIINKEPTRHSERSNRGVPPDRYIAPSKNTAATARVALENPKSRKEALEGPNSLEWEQAMDEEINPCLPHFSGVTRLPHMGPKDPGEKNCCKK